MRRACWRCVGVCLLLALAGGLHADIFTLTDPVTGAMLEAVLMNSGPTAPLDIGGQGDIVSTSQGSPYILSSVPTSPWTYGCSATSAGMLFGYYDRNGYGYMYKGPEEVAPLTDLGSTTSLIATKQGFDGYTTYGHVDDYWISNNSTGPDPWVTAGRAEHAWADCVADFMGTNQWKWDYNLNGTVDSNRDGGTTVFSYTDGSKLYDYIPPSSYGLPQTELNHGLRLFAESRGYTVLENYTQRIDTAVEGGFSLVDYQWEIDHGYPLLVQLYGHTMVGVGYDAATNAIYVHDTWDNLTHSMTWGGSYGGYQQYAVTVIHLDPAGPIPEPGTLVLLGLGLPGLALLRRRRRAA